MITTASAQQVILTVHGVDVEQGGQIAAGLYNSPDGWTKSGREWSGSIEAVTTETSVILTFDDVPPGHYALAIMHDSNSNGKMDKSFLGLPKEGYCFSNNARGRLGPPDFQDAAFKVAKGQVTQLKVDMGY